MHSWQLVQFGALVEHIDPSTEMCYSLSVLHVVCCIRMLAMMELSFSISIRYIPVFQIRHNWSTRHSPSSLLFCPFCQVLDADQSAFPYRFQRTDLWKPVYQWLESLDMDSLVATQQISDWLTSNPKIMDRLVEKHSKYHLIHYTQRMHLKMLKKKGKLPKVHQDSLLFFMSAKLANEHKKLILNLQTLQLSAARATTQPSGAPVVPEESIVPLQKTTPPATGFFSTSSCIFLVLIL